MPRVFVRVLACVRARVAVVCSYNHRLCVIDFATRFRTFFSCSRIRFSLAIPIKKLLIGSKSLTNMHK